MPISYAHTVFRCPSPKEGSRTLRPFPPCGIPRSGNAFSAGPEIQYGRHSGMQLMSMAKPAHELFEQVPFPPMQSEGPQGSKSFKFDRETRIISQVQLLVPQVFGDSRFIRFGCLHVAKTFIHNRQGGGLGSSSEGKPSCRERSHFEGIILKD